MHVAGAQRRLPVGAGGDREGAGGEEPVALGQVAAGEAVAVIGAVAQVERHHRAVEQAQDAAQRAHPGERRWCRPSASIWATGSGAAGRAVRGRSGRRRRCRAPLVRARSNRLPGAVARGWRRACGGSRPAPARGRCGAARARRCGFGDARRDVGRQRDPARAVRKPRRSVGDSGAKASAIRRAQVLGRPRLHAGGNFLAEQFQEQFGHGQPPPPPATPRSSPSPACARGRYSWRARSR